VQIVFLCFRIGELNQVPVHWVVTILEWIVAALVAISTLDYARRIFGAAAAPVLGTTTRK
jgi:hypothetical protein